MPCIRVSLIGLGVAILIIVIIVVVVANASILIVIIVIVVIVVMVNMAIQAVTIAISERTVNWMIKWIVEVTWRRVEMHRVVRCGNEENGKKLF